MKRIFATILLLALGLSLLACNGDGTGIQNTSTNGGTTAATTGGNAPEDMPDDDTPPSGPVDLDLAWHYGYVASATHSTTPNQLVENGEKYSYSDVFTVRHAGTTVTFMDDNTNSNGDQMFASKNCFVFSSWIKEGEEWVLDRYGFNYAGDTSTDSPIVAVSMGGKILYSYTTSVDNENIRVCFRSGQTASFTPASYPTVVLEYTEKSGTAKDKLALKNWVEGTKSDYYNEILKGVTINALGDSYFAGQGLPQEEIWLHLLGSKYNMNMNNYGIGGSTITTCTGNKDPMCTRYQSMANNNPDIIFLEGGRNDYNKQAAIGTATSKDTATFTGALNVTIDGLQQKYPNAMIVVISAWNYPPTNPSATYTREMYHEAMRIVAEAQGVYFLDASNPATIGVDMTSESFRTKYCVASTDISHLNAAGMKLVMPNFEKMIAEFYADFLSKQ